MGTNRTIRQAALLIAGVIALAAVGCRDQVDDVPMPQPFKGPAPQPVAASVPAGVPVGRGPETMFINQVTSYKTNPRPDPFALETPERLYDTKQENERVVAVTGSFFPPSYVEKPETVQIEQVEPQPFRRLAGILVGDSVTAIIDMGDGRPMQVIRPGMQIPNSPWRVVSIDEDKAVLRRSGNKRPKEVVVRLESPQFNPGQIQQQPGQGQPTQPPAGGEGGGPPGRRGRGRSGGGGVGAGLGS